MSYHDLSSCTLTADERREEANRILKMLELPDNIFSDREAKFLDQMREGGFVSIKQLFWLRDLKDKYL